MRLSRDLLLFVLLGVNGLHVTLLLTFGMLPTLRYFILGAALIIAVRSLYFEDRTRQMKTLIALAFLGDNIFLLLLPILFTPKFLFFAARKFKDGGFHRLPFIAFVFLLFSIILIIITNLFDFAFFNIMLWYLTFAAYPLIFIYYSQDSYDEDSVIHVFEFFRKVISLQILILLAQALIHQDFRPGDSWVGSSGNSIVVGVFLTLLLLYRFVPYFVNLKRRVNILKILALRNILFLIVVATLLYLNDSKMIILSFVVAVCLYFLYVLILRFFSRFKKHLLIKVTIASLLIGCLLISVSKMANEYVRITYGDSAGVRGALGPYLSSELDESGLNAKAVLYKRVYIDLFSEDFGAWLIGVGPGKFGSRASNTMAYDILYKLEDQAKLPTFIGPYSAEYTRMYMGDLWTESQVEMNKFRSATLSFPFAGLITMKAEYGMIGLVLFLFLLYAFSYYMIKKAFVIENVNIKNWALVLSIFWFSLPFHMVFDNFQEKNSIMLPIFLVSAAVISTVPGRAYKHQRKEAGSITGGYQTNSAEKS